MASKPGTLSPEQIERDYATAAKHAKVKNTLTYTGARGWFVLDGANARGNDVIEAGRKLVKGTPLAKTLFVKADEPKRGPGRPPKAESAVKAKPAAKAKGHPLGSVKSKAKAKKAAPKPTNGNVAAQKPNAKSNGKGPVVNPAAKSGGKRVEVTVKLSADVLEVVNHLGGGSAEAGIAVLAGYYRSTAERIAKQAMEELLGQEG